MTQLSKQVIFLDRDGTMNVDHGYVHTIDQWEWHKGAIEALKILKEAGYILAITTNQSGIGNGLYTEKDMHTLHEFMKKELEKNGIHIGAIAFCPHMQDGNCDCRKPKPGMARQIEQQMGAIDYPNSWVIGDKVADMQFGKAIGSKTALIRSRYWTEEELPDQPDIIVDSLSEAAEQIVKQVK